MFRRQYIIIIIQHGGSGSLQDVGHGLLGTPVGRVYRRKRGPFARVRKLVIKGGGCRGSEGSRSGGSCWVSRFLLQTEGPV
jgi:hypothetical protein